MSEVSSLDFALVHQWSYGSGLNQQWAIQRDAQGYYQLVARHSGKLLDVQNANLTEGGNVDQYTANGTIAQQWTIEQRTCSTNSSARSSADYEPIVSAFRLWPNPAQDHVLIDLEAAAGQLTDITLVDITGKVMYQASVKTDTESTYRLTTSTFSQGNYLITVKPLGQSPTTLRLLLVR